MLKELLPLLRGGDTLGFSLACETPETKIGDAPATPATYRVNITPALFTTDGQHGPDRLALNEPLTVIGTLEELDTELVPTLRRYTTSITTTRNTIDAVETTQKAAMANRKLRTSPKPGATKPAATTPEAGDDKDEPEEPETPVAPPKPAVPAKPADAKAATRSLM